MDPVYETLEHQTAPESTRGLFDPPEERPSAMKSDKRRSFHGLPPMTDDNRQQPHHQRSRSAIEVPPSQNGRRNFGLQTLTEEGEEAHRKRREDVASVTVDSFQDMINTLKTLPPITSRVDRRASQRRSVSNINFGPQLNRMSLNEQSKRRSMQVNLQSDHEDDEAVSREAALAEAEAKLTGKFKREEPLEDDVVREPSLNRSNNHRRSSHVDQPTRRRYSDAASSSVPFDVSQLKPSVSASKRMSLQMPTLSENMEEHPWRNTGRHPPSSRTLSVGDSRKQKNRQSLRNLEDWRISGPQQSVTSSFSPRQSFSANRASVNLVPITPMRTNFSRDDANPHQRRPLFLAHLPFSALAPMFRSRILVRGMLRVNKRNRSDAYVHCEETDVDIYVCGSRDRNRALEGDIVAVRLLDVPCVLQEKKEKEDAKLMRNNGQVRQRLPDEEDENEIIFGGDDDVDLVKPAFCGVVVAILERAQNQVFSGTLTLMRPNNKRAQEEKTTEDGLRKDAPRIVWFKATDKRVPLIAIPIEQAPEDFKERSEDYAERLFVSSIKRWPITSLHPFGLLVDELGAISDIHVQTKAILADHNISYAEFSDPVYSCLPSIPYMLSDVSDMHRRDLRTLPAFTVDPVGSNVLDDAISIQRLADDTFEVGVHVADVAYFIKANSALDKEARTRAVQVDLTHKTVPMVPPVLTEQVTNLSPHSPRLAFSVIWKVNSQGKVLDTWFGKTVVKSVAKLTYEDAQDILDGHPLSDAVDEAVRERVEQDVHALYSIASRLHEARFATDAMSLRREELHYTFDEDESTTNASEPSGAYIQERPAAAKLVKEFLLLANTSVAQKIARQLPDQALLRRQAPPVGRKLEELRAYASQYLGVDLDTSSANAIEQSVCAIDDPKLRTLVTVIVLKTLQAPRYYCTGSLDILKYMHYSLNTPLFTHFTAPSRRFVDLVVQRQLDAALTMNKDRFYLDRDTVQKLAQHCTVKKEAAIRAREQSNMLFLSLYLHRVAQHSTLHVVHREAIVIAVFDQCFDVIVPEFSLERRVHLANLPVWRDEFDAEKRALTMYWKKGVMTATGEHHRWSLSDDEYEDEDLDEDGLLAEMQSQASGSSLSDAQKRSASVATTPKLDERTLNTLSIQPTRSSPPTLQRSPEKSTHKRQSIISARLSSSTAYSSEHGSQTIQALDKIRVILTVEMIRTPPLIRVLASNPYA